MEPQGRLADAKVFLESCPGLSEDQRTFYKRYLALMIKVVKTFEFVYIFLKFVLTTVHFR